MEKKTFKKKFLKNVTHWMNFHREYKELSIKKCKHMYEIDQISLDGNLIKTWKNMLEIREIYPTWSSNISACLNGLRKTTNKFIWKKHES